MLANVTNRSRGSRGFDTLDRGIVLLEPGATALLDLADHPLHRTWAAAGSVSVAPLPEKEAKAMRKRIEAEADSAARERAQALAALPGAAAH